MIIQFLTGQGRSIHAFEDADTRAGARRRLPPQAGGRLDERPARSQEAAPQPSSVARYSETAANPPSRTPRAVA